MASELFHKMYRDAFRLDCWLITALNKLTAARSLGPGSTTQRAMLASNLHEAGKEFTDTMEQLVQPARRGMQPNTLAFIRTTAKMICPNCHSPYCGNAIPMVEIPAGIHIKVISPAGVIKQTDDEE